MYLVCYGTRPEALKLLPLISKLGDQCKTLFTGQHPDMTFDIIAQPDYVITDVLSHGQSLDILGSKVLSKVSEVISMDIFHRVIVQGDTISAFMCTLSAFHNKKIIIHIEAGLRTHDKYSPFPEEVYRTMISRMADIHLCPTKISSNNLLAEGISSNVFVVGNTIVDTFEQCSNTKGISGEKYILVTLHRRENRGEKMLKMWDQLNKMTTHRIKYIIHPSLPDVTDHLTGKHIELLKPQTYSNMISLILNSEGIITDSGGLQEEAVCARKKILVCRDTTERPETIQSGWGKLVDIEITSNIDFLYTSNKNLENPYGKNVCNKILSIVNV